MCSNAGNYNNDRFSPSKRRRSVAKEYAPPTNTRQYGKAKFRRYPFPHFPSLHAWAGGLGGCACLSRWLENENTKHNGEAWVKWLKESSEPRMQENFAIESCSASTDERRRWGDCFEAILQNVKELQNQSNAFTGQPLEFIAKCDPKDRSTVGSIVLEKIVPTPPGSAIATITSQLLATDVIDAKITLKLTVCDKGGYPVKVDELEF